MKFLRLGASLYVPATREDLVEIGNLHKFPGLRSVIFCTEDAVHERDLALCLKRLESALAAFAPSELLRFIRVRNASVLRSLLQMNDIHNITGFVLPKATEHNIEEYFAAFRPDDPFEVMVTLESAEVFEPERMRALRNFLLQERHRRRILSLRVGGNDLLHLLGMRRPRDLTLYDTPLGSVLSQLVTIFRPHGFNLTAPVFDYLDNDRILQREVKTDLAHGLFGKSAIHPRHVPVVEKQYRVSREELHMAEKILADAAPAVFRLHDAMCEPATHHTWARIVHERAKIYGVKSDGRRARQKIHMPRNGTAS